MEVYLLVHDHKHGQDYHVFSGEDLAWERAFGLARGALEEWGKMKITLTSQTMSWCHSGQIFLLEKILL